MTDNVLDEVRAERKRQDEIWGEQNHPSFPPAILSRNEEDRLKIWRMAENYEIPTEERAKHLCNHAEKRGEVTFTHIALEEFCEVVGSCNEPESETRKELVQLAAVVVAWIEAIDKRNKAR